MGEEIVTALRLASHENDLDLAGTSVFVDEGIKSAPSDGVACEIHWNQDSRAVFGLQIADLIAALGAFILKEALHGERKSVRPYRDEVEAPLGWTFKMQLRNNLFRRHPAFDENAPELWHDAELLGVGVFVGERLPPQVTVAVQSVFSRVWTGCTR